MHDTTNESPLPEELTNRPSSSSIFCNASNLDLLMEDPGAGCDKLAFTLPLKDWVDDPAMWRTYWFANGGSRRPTQKYEALLSVDGAAGIHVQAFWNDARGAQYVRISGNPARLLDPLGWHPCPIARVHDAAQIMLATAEELVIPAAPLMDADVSLFDITRDFDVANAKVFLEGASLIRQRRPRKNTTWRDAYGRPEGVYIQRPKQGCADGYRVLYRLYRIQGKHSGAPPGALRWEGTYEKDRCQRLGGIAVMADITPESAGRLLVNGFEDSRLGSWICCPDGFLQALESLAVRKDGKPMQEADRNEVAGYVSRSRAGLGSPLNRHRREKIDYALTKIGVPVVGSPSGHRHRLDVMSGREVMTDVA